MDPLRRAGFDLLSVVLSQACTPPPPTGTRPAPPPPPPPLRYRYYPSQSLPITLPNNSSGQASDDESNVDCLAGAGDCDRGGEVAGDGGHLAFDRVGVEWVDVDD